MKWLYLFFLLLIPDACFLQPGQADAWKNLQQGDQTSKILLDQMKAKQKEAGAHPFYQGISKESKISSDNLKGQAQKACHSDPAAQMVTQSHDSRVRVKIDPQKDPLLTGSQQVMNPLEVIGGKGAQVIETQQGGKTETLTCEESGEDSEESCTRELTVKVIKSKVRKEWEGQFRYWKERKATKKKHYLACMALRQGARVANKQQNSNVTAAYLACMRELGGQITAGYVSLPELPFAASQIVEVHFKMGKRKKRSKKLRVLQSGYIDSNDHGTKYDLSTHIKIIYDEETYEVLPDEWTDNCARLEERVDQGLCGYVSRICTAPNQTRSIEGIPITRACWQETQTYSCSLPAKDDCSPLRARGCAQIHSECKQRVGNACVVYQQTYQCKDSPKTTFQIQGGNTPFCMDGNCRDQTWEPNDELMSSVAQLSILKEMQGNFKNGFLFKGEDNRCSKYIVSFKDCCGSGKGWGKDMGLGSCKAQEKLLNQRRKAGLCHRVGTYCDKKILGQCVKKKTSYCCFSSKLLKAFQEQGRKQIGLGWGKAKKPLCRGFTIQEIQKIDFSKLDLREAFEDIMKNFKPGKMGDIERQVGERLEIIKQGMVPHAKQPQTKQREGGA